MAGGLRRGPRSAPGRPGDASVLGLMPGARRGSARPVTRLSACLSVRCGQAAAHSHSGGWAERTRAQPFPRRAAPPSCAGGHPLHWQAALPACRRAEERTGEQCRAAVRAGRRELVINHPQAGGRPPYHALGDTRPVPRASARLRLPLAQLLALRLGRGARVRGSQRRGDNPETFILDRAQVREGSSLLPPSQTCPSCFSEACTRPTQSKS